MCEVIITPEQIEDLERRKPDLRQMWARWGPILAKEEALQETASAYKEGRITGSEEEAERLMREKFDELKMQGRGD